MGPPTWHHGFTLGVHRVDVRLDAALNAELSLDGCLRKQRQAAADCPCYLWTNVELPFEDHHLVEVRLIPGAADSVDITVSCNGETLHGAHLTSKDYR